VCACVHPERERASKQVCVRERACPLQIILQMIPVPVSHCAGLFWQAAWTEVWRERERERERRNESRGLCCEHS